MIRSIQVYFSKKNQRFKPFREREDDYSRIATIHTIASLFIAPIYVYAMQQAGAPKIYVDVAVLYAVSFIVFVSISYFVKPIRPWLIYAIIIQLFVATYFTYDDLRSTGYAEDQFIFFLAFYAICTIIIQRFYTAVLYHLSAILMLLVDYRQIELAHFSPFLIVGIFLVISTVSCMVIYVRQQLYVSVHDYIDYLKRIMNNPGSGYILFDLESRTLIDHNEEVIRMFNETAVGLGDSFFKVFDQEELKSISELKLGHNFKKKISLSRFKARQYVELKVTRIQIKNETYFLAILTNITDDVLKHEELQIKEKRYRNLYFRNKAGVFTLNNQTHIIDGNDSFFRMFESTLKKGDRLFEMEAYNDWNLIMESLKSSKKAQSYQTQYILKSGVKKTFVFNWYIDEQTGYIEGSVIDLTSIEKATQALKESEEKYRLIYEESKDAILLLDGDKIVDVNRRSEEMFGLNRDTLLMKNLFELSFDRGIRQEKLYQHEKSKLSASRSIRFNWLFEGELSVIEAEVSLIEVMIGNKLFYQCVIHDVTEQNKLAKEQLRAELAEEANVRLAAEIEERIKAETRLQEQFLRTRAIFESSSNTLLLTVSLDGRVSFCNSHCFNYFYQNFGLEIERNENLLDCIESIVSPQRLRLLRLIFAKVQNGASRQYEVLLYSNPADKWIELFVNPIFDTEGEVVEISLVAHDISEKKKSSIEIEESLKEKEVLLKEIHHRVKNNLQVISSILNLQSSFVTDENTLGILQESRNRIRSMAIIHENLYRTEDFSSIRFDNYLKNLTANLIASYSVNRKIQLNMNLDEVDLVLDQAIPCGLLTNELITNSLKYAWGDNSELCIITMRLQQKDTMVELEVSDNGIGLPNDFSKMQSDTLGLQLVATLAEQLDAELEVDVSHGTKYLLKFENIKPNSHV